MYTNILFLLAIIIPTLSAILCYVIKKPVIRNVIVILSTILMLTFVVGIIKTFMENNGRLVFSLDELNLPFSIGFIIKCGDFLLLSYLIYLGYKLKNRIIIILSLLQFIPLLIFDLTKHPKEIELTFVIDHLSLIMLLLVSIIGPVIAIFSLGYMKEHEIHSKIKKSKQPKFFFIIFIFLAAMNGLVMSNDLSWLYFFWEITTLCSYLLISFDKNEISIKNGVRALIINMAGGVAFVFAIIILYSKIGTLDINELINISDKSLMSGLFPIGIGLLCLAGFTKSAQFPFQSWLLGAMVAPTPVSALLHSSTMVKAGVYIVLRLSPSYNGTTLSNIIAILGGLTFVSASAIAISQSNGKRVLAYSTIANLGIIICCAGLGSYVAIAAGILLVIFHAFSKGLLFLCVGTIENNIGSRDIEDMQGLMKKMPFTTIITVIGMITMLLPPFGVLITKWLALEAAVKFPLVLVLLILGSAFTVVFWSQWIGIILTMSYKKQFKLEKLKFSIKASLTFMLSGVLIISVLIVPIYNKLINPYVKEIFPKDSLKLMGDNGIWIVNNINNEFGGFTPMYYFILIMIIFLTIPYLFFKVNSKKIKKPYLCGENTDDIKGIEFISAIDKSNSVIVHNYYLDDFFGEKKLTLLTNLISWGIILIMFGVLI